MNIAERAYQDGQDYRRANNSPLEGEALETQVMQAFTQLKMRITRLFS
jgi:hypothetical protein